jgi:hypothetical protein
LDFNIEPLIGIGNQLAIDIPKVASDAINDPILDVFAARLKRPDLMAKPEMATEDDAMPGRDLG